MSSFDLVGAILNCCSTKVLEPEKSGSCDERPCVYGGSDHNHDSGQTTVATLPSPSSTDSLVHSPSSNTSQNFDLDGLKSHRLLRTSPGTVFAPPFKHFTPLSKPSSGSKSFVEYFSRKITTTIFHTASKENGSLNGHEDSPGGARPPTNWVRNFLLQDDSSKRSSGKSRTNDQVLLPHAKPTPAKSYPITIASLFASKGASTSTADFASVSVAATSDERATGVELVFTEKEDEYARKIDLFVRTRGNFDTRHPLSFAIKTGSLVRDFLRVEMSSAFSGSEALAPSEIMALLRKHPRFRVSRDSKSVSLAYLTPYHRESSSDEDEVMLYGYFLCSICKRRWESGVSWQDTWQRCRHCQAQIFPYDQHEPISREKLLAKLLARQLHSRSTSATTSNNASNNASNNTSNDTSNNTSNSSSSYNVLKNKLSAAEQSVDGSSDSPLGVIEGDTTDDGAHPSNGTADDEEDNDDLAVDIFSLRDRIERHKKQWCQKCLALGHLCIPYRHYSV